MNKHKPSEKARKLISDIPSDWLEKANWYEENKSWLEKSAAIAFKILRTLREKSISQLEFAEMINVSPQYVSKILKGKENLTLKTIDTIEKCLCITLQDVYIKENEPHEVELTEDPHVIT